MNVSRSLDGHLFLPNEKIRPQKKLEDLEYKSNVCEQESEQFSIQKPLYPNLEFRRVFQFL